MFVSLCLKVSSHLYFFAAKFGDVLTDLPSRADVVEHEVNLTTDDSIRNKPYQIHTCTQRFCWGEIIKIVDIDIIEPPESPYASSIVVAKKQDGTNRK